jgi:hypothetical protein
MTSEGPRVGGSCFCGAIRFSVQMPSLFCGHCHCRMCRRSHGAGHVTWFVVKREQFRIDSGEESLVRHASSDHGTRSFCGRCGSSLLCESTHHADQVDIVLANMDGPIDQAPQMHIFFDDRAEWTDIQDALPRLGGETGMEPIDS